ncbi:uncharacterized protein A1O5_07198 [Cladophialophora psammophila CBS 110553]|uniref:Protein kinase domain-containing protein n=1 Tax=Cladophialophora psammophila CBS 110553 TaxID=1182543 RepID=W9WYI4_9EURO|nr:uncharacterized protein A1O5_07198 [Cladophialophora psammophila CBS 110553]EXJ70125.1 hypothetical protein A1O5_07198 [Cladophialophora psammophila CBS 110553]
MEPVGLAVACAGAFQQLFEIALAAKKAIDAAKNFGDEAIKLQDALGAHRARATALQGLLFDPFGDTAPGQEIASTGSQLFDEIPEYVQLAIVDCLRQCDRVETARYPSLEGYQRTGMEAKVGMKSLDHLNESPEEIMQRKARTATLAKWAIKDRKKMKKMVEEYGSWISMAFQLVRDYLLIVETNDRRLTALEKSRPAAALGLAQDARLRRITAYEAVPPDVRIIKLDLDMRDLDIGEQEAPAEEAAEELTSSLQKLSVQGQLMLVEYHEYTVDISATAIGSVPPLVHEQVGQLAALMQSPKPAEFLALQSTGLLHQPALNRFAFFYEIPGNPSFLQMENLEQIVQKHQFLKPSLTQRVWLARRLVGAVANFHTVGWIHKSLRSANVVFFRQSWPEYAPFPDDGFSNLRICGFEYSRPSQPGVGSLRYADSSIARNVYRHPERWGKPAKYFMPQHDFYALGVILLEIGLWESVFSLQSHRFKNWRENPELVRQRILEHTRTRLAAAAGEEYAKVVLLCLTVKSPWEDDSGVEIQAWFQTNVVESLEGVAC